MSFYNQSSVTAWYGTTFQAQAYDWYSSVATWEPGSGEPAPSQALSNAFNSFDTMAYFQQRAAMEEQRRAEEQARELRENAMRQWAHMQQAMLDETWSRNKTNNEALMDKYPEMTEY